MAIIIPNKNHACVIPPHGGIRWIAVGNPSKSVAFAPDPGICRGDSDGKVIWNYSRYANKLTCVLLLLSCGAANQAQAQAIDYNSLEALVGQPVTMSATGTPQREQDVPANMTIITADQIRQSGSRDIPEILSRVPGLDILRESTHSFDVGVRGYQQSMQPRLLVLIDGRQVFLDDYSRTIWENLPVNIDNIRQIEVVKGPSSALFGSNAAGGVINIITYNPLFDNNNVAAATYGTQGNATLDGTKTVKIGTSGGIRISAGGLAGHEFDTPRTSTGFYNEKSVTTSPEHEYTNASGVFQLTPDIVGNTEFTYSKSDGTEGYYNGLLADVGAETWSTRAGLSWQTPIGTIKSNNYYNHALVDNNEISQSLPHYDDTTDLAVSQLEDQFKLGKDHTFRLSGEYQFKQFHLDAPHAAPVDTTIHENNLAVSGMWLWQLTDKLSWTNAVREDHLGLGLDGTLYAGDPFTDHAFDHALNETSANSGFVLQATDEDTFRLSYGRGVQFPSLLDYGFNTINRSAAGGAVEREGNPYLHANIVTNYEVGYDRSIKPLSSTAKLSLFYQDNSSIVSPFSTVTANKVTSVSPTTRLREPTNIESSNGLGGELQLLGSSASGFRWDASYSYASVGDNAVLLKDFGYENSTPMHHFRLLLGYTTGDWEFDTNAQYMTSRTLFRLNTSRENSGDYTTLGGRIGYKITPGITASLSGTDLGQANTHESPYPAIERQVMLGLTARF